MSDRVPEGWEKKELSFLTNLVSEKTEFNNQFEALTSSRSGLFKQSEYFNKRVTSVDNTGYRIIAPGQFTFRAMSDDGTFKFNRSTYSFTGVVSPAYEVFEAKNCSPDFLDYVLNSDEFHQQIYANAQGGTRLALKYSSLSKLEVQFPSVPEQKKIASILTSVDELIEKTQFQIDKLQDLKKASVNELLTKGIGHTEFKDSELGRISKIWEEMTLGAAVQKNIITDIQDGNHGTQHPKASDYVKDGIPFVMASNLKGGVIDVGNANKIPREIYDNLRIGFAKTGDVLLTHKATIGLVAIVNEDTPEVMCTPQVTYYRIGSKDKLRSRFLFYWFQSDQFQNEMVRLSGQSTRDYIGITAQKTLLVRIPPMGEQVEIIKILESIDHNLFMKKHSLRQTQSLKKSLMQDLLTGKVRVQVN